MRVARPILARRRQAVSSRGLGVLQLDRTQRHDRRDRVLVNELRLPVPAQKNAEIVEPSDVSLKLHAVDEKDRHRRFALTNGVEKGVLQILLFFAHGWTHFVIASHCLAPLAEAAQA